ncbi:MAG: rod shape-determining protein MreD [Succinivibrionaceae bacterium]
MNIRTLGCYCFIWVTILVFLILSLLQLPIYISVFVPNYVVAVILCWTIICPNKINVLSCWFVGLLMDILLGCDLGIHSTSFALMAWMMITQFENIRNYSLLQKTLVAGTICFIGQFILFWVEHIFGGVIVGFDIFWSSVSTFIFLPIIYNILFSVYNFIEHRKFSEYI